jgi:MFS family permease
MRINRAWLGLVVLMLPTLLVAMDMTALLLALPRLSAGLGATNIEQLWISDSYGFMVAGLVITMGALGDRIGRRRLLMIGGAAFAVLSVVAAFSVSPLMLIVARALLGVAGATLAPSTLALITNMFRDERQRGQAIAIWATCQFTGGAIGPVLAGFLLEHFWWGSVFLAAVPAMALLLLAGPALLPEFRGDQAGRLDLASVGLSLAAVLLLVYGIKQLTVDSVPVVPAVALVAGAVTGLLFVRRQLRLGTGLVVGSVAPERAGSAASMSETGNYLGGSLGFALLGVLAAVVYRDRMHGTSDSLAGAVAASRHLPAGQSAELLHTAREAFTASLHVTGVIAALIFAGLAVLILTMRPATRTTPAALPDELPDHKLPGYGLPDHELPGYELPDHELPGYELSDYEATRS